MSYERHGESKTKLYRIWNAMKDRAQKRIREGEACRVYKPWAESFLTFKAFALANGWKDGLLVCRLEDTGDYTPNNIRFDTKQSNVEEALSDSYTLLSPKRVKVEVFNMSQFCRDNDLRKSCMFEIFSEKHCRKSHKGWRKYVT